MNLTHCSEKVNTALQSVSDSQIQSGITHTVRVYECYSNIPIKQFINILMIMIMTVIIVIIK
jgi:hypothetical protein